MNGGCAMKKLLWLAFALLVVTTSAHADDAKLVGKWHAEYAVTSKDKPHIAWILELEKGGTFRLVTFSPNVPEKLRKETERLETGRWWIIEPSLTEILKSNKWKNETQVRLRFAPTAEDVKRGDVREYFGKAIEKDERYNGKTTLHLVSVTAIQSLGLPRANDPTTFYNFVREE